MARRAILFEEHASVLPHWMARGVREATVVCFDAHLDLQFIGAERLDRLHACGSAAEIARLESVHPFSPRRGTGYGIEDFLYAAARLQVLRRLVWVAPPHVLAQAARGWSALRQMEGVTPQDLGSFRRVAGGWIEGRLLGVELAVVEYRQLPALPLDGPVAVDIDADYFVQVPQDRTWVAPRRIVEALKDRVGDAQEVTVSRSVGSGFLPLGLRYLADHVAALWEGREAEAQFWDRLFAVEAEPADPEHRARALRELLALRPECAALCHALAVHSTDAAEREAMSARAAALDGHYAPDPLRDLAGLRARGQSVDLAHVARLQRSLAAWRGTPERSAAGFVALGLLHAGFGHVQEAIECDRASRLQGEGHPDLALQIGRLELERGRTEEALPWLEAAARDDETRVVAWLALSACAWRRADAGAATVWARKAIEAAPAWPDPAPWLRSAPPAAARLGGTGAAP